MGFTVFKDAHDLDLVLARDIAARLAAAIMARGSASLVVSGGRTPVELFDVLSRQRLPWEAVVVTMADERWVEPSHVDSNERLIRFHLLCNAAAAASFVPLKNAAATPEEGAAITAAALADIPRPFDVVLLGMGLDAHTASLFPGAAALSAGLDAATTAPCLAVRPPRAPHARMSMTLAALLDSRRVLVQIAGAQKRAVIDRALESGPAEDMPIRGVLHQQAVPVDIYWCP